MDFFKIVERSKRDELEVFPDFQTGEVSDLLGRGKSFYAVWDEAKGMWSQNENDVQRIVDEALWKHVEDLKERRGFEGRLNVKTLKSDSSGMWNRFTQYMRRFPDSKIQLDNKLIFLNTKTKKKDYASKRLSYALEPGEHAAWDELMDRLYSPSEREKIEWAIGAVVAGESGKIEKFFVFYGDPGSGKGTVIRIIRKLFEGYCVTFDAKSLGTSSDQFSMEVFKSNPLVAVDPDSDLSRIDDNTRLNKIVSHEEVVINEKGKARYNSTMNCFIFVGSNSPVKISDGKSGIRRRLIDIHPTGKTFKSREYDSLISRIDFELGAIASHCLDVYRDLGKNYYKNYSPQEMIAKTDVFFNFIEYNIDTFERQCDGMSLKQAYSMWKEYKEVADLEYKLPMHRFREELKNYYETFEEVVRIDGKQIRSWYSGFLDEKMHPPVLKRLEKTVSLTLDKNVSLLDDILADCPAQYGVDDGSGNEKPSFVWGEVESVLDEIDTKKVHYVQPQKFNKNFIVVDFDLKNRNGEKDRGLNAEAASKWPPTYTEYSKGGSGIHLHYIYDGDISKLNPVYAKGIEIKIFRGRAALRRRLSWCNDLPIAHLPSGSLPLKGEKMIDTTILKDEQHLRNLIRKCLRKGNHGATRPEIDLINKALEEARESGMSYDVSDLGHDILVFAMNSSHQSEYCVDLVNRMELVSEDRKQKEEEIAALGKDDPNAPLVIFDIEIYKPTEEGEVDADGEENPGLFLICWKEFGEGKPVSHMVNPKPHEVEEFLRLKLGGFNNLGYDNAMLYFAMMGYDNAQLYEASRRIINEKARDVIPREAKNISYLDVFDLASEKKGLKKWEIDLGISHIEMGIPWDKPAPRRLWDKIIEYCENDVLATEAVLINRKADLIAREILADLANGRVNDTTNSLTTRFIFGGDRHPELVYTELATGERSDGSVDESILGSFPDYRYESAVESEDGKRHNWYRGVDLGFGGYSYSEPGIYTDVALIDIQSMHPSSMVAMNYFGKYTQRFKDILDARIAIKNKDFDKARAMFDGALTKYLEDEEQADGLAQALKIAINSCYGLTAAGFDNPFRDKRNVNNIVALRGALFMKTLLDELQSRGVQVVHLKVDSMKIPNATLDIIEFCKEFAQKYGYSFAHEATYDRLCLVDKANYIAAYKDTESCMKMYGYVPSDNSKNFRKHSHPWTATGDAFQHPYLFKTLFSGEIPEFADYCETKSVRDAAIYLDMNEKLPNVELYEKEMERRTHNAQHPEKKPMRLNPEYNDISDEELAERIGDGHDYRFVGRVGSFFPVRRGAGGGLLMAKRNGKYSSVNGTKGYRWLESEAVRELGKDDEYDPGYFDRLITEAIDSINKMGDYDRFIDMSRPYSFVSKVSVENGAVVPCGDGKYNSCVECPRFADDICKLGYSMKNEVSYGGGVK